MALFLRKSVFVEPLFRNYARKTLCSAAGALTKDDFKTMVSKNKVVVFMKGVPEQPRCGFSNAVVQLLNMHGVKFDSYDVLSNDSIRQGIKDFTSWPTIPQVFINGEFVGGCDIMLQMHQNGSLVEELRKCGIKSLLEGSAEAEDKK